MLELKKQLSDHTALDNIGSNTHAQIDTALALDATHRSGAVMSHPVIEQNIMLNAFRTAVVGSLSVQKMVDGFTDEYEDETGVDTAGSTNESYDSTNDLYKPAGDYQATIAAEAALIHYYKMDNNWNDSKGTNNGSATGATFGTAKYGSNSGSFDGNDYVSLTPIQAFMGTGNYTVEAWVKLTTSSSYPEFLSIAVDGDHEIRFQIDINGKATFITYEGGYGNIVGVTNVVDNNWHHVVFVKNGTTGYIYVDSALDASGTIKNVLGTANWSTIGVHRWGTANFGNYYNDLVDEISIYNTNLSASTISTHFNGGTVGNMTLLSTAQTAESTPTNARIVLFEEDVDATTINTDIKAYSSRDNGTTYTQIILSDEGDYDTNKRILTGTVDISAQPSGTSMKYKVETLNNKNLKLHSTAVLWS